MMCSFWQTLIDCRSSWSSWGSRISLKMNPVGGFFQMAPNLAAKHVYYLQLGPIRESSHYNSDDSSEEPSSRNTQWTINKWQTKRLNTFVYLSLPLSLLLHEYNKLLMIDKSFRKITMTNCFYQQTRFVGSDPMDCKSPRTFRSAFIPSRLVIGSWSRMPLSKLTTASTNASWAPRAEVGRWRRRISTWRFTRRPASRAPARMLSCKSIRGRIWFAASSSIRRPRTKRSPG